MTIDCCQVEALVDELALGHLTGADRAAVLAHLDECHACRAEIASLTTIGDAVLLLAPAARPDAGFDARVLDRIARAGGSDAGAPRARADVTPLPRPRRARALVAAAAAMVVVVASALWAVRGSTPAEVAAAMIDGRGATVGQVALIADQGTTVQLDLPGWERLATSYGTPPDGEYHLEIRHDDGSRQTVVVAAAPGGRWQVHTSTDRADIAGIAIADRDGRVWCEARFV